MEKDSGKTTPHHNHKSGKVIKCNSVRNSLQSPSVYSFNNVDLYDKVSQLVFSTIVHPRLFIVKTVEVNFAPSELSYRFQANLV